MLTINARLYENQSTYSKWTYLKAEKGSACSQLIGETRTFSGKDSGTATRMKNTSKIATAVASATTRESDHLEQ